MGRFPVLLAALAFAIGAPAALAADGGAAAPNGERAAEGEVDPGSAPTAKDRSGDPDFFFGRPSVSLILRGGAFLPRAEGQFFDFVTRELTLDRDDFRSPAGGLEVGIWVGERLEVAGSFDLAAATRRSEFRDWLEETPDGELIPIEQSTRLRHGPTLMLGLKAYPLARGDRLGEFVWVPNRLAPYVYGGIGGTRWKLEQWGDWVVTTGPDEGAIFTEEFETDGFSFVAGLGGGLDVTLRPRVALTLEGRYMWGDGQMRRDFIEFIQPLDLSGLRVTAGLSFRF